MFTDSRHKHMCTYKRKTEVTWKDLGQPFNLICPLRCFWKWKFCHIVLLSILISDFFGKVLIWKERKGNGERKIRTLERKICKQRVHQKQYSPSHHLLDSSLLELACDSLLIHFFLHKVFHPACRHAIQFSLKPNICTKKTINLSNKLAEKVQGYTILLEDSSPTISRELLFQGNELEGLDLLNSLLLTFLGLTLSYLCK